jgi:L-ascorbate metabolism protein UlaG (beta-lactamase superfamily)
MFVTKLGHSCVLVETEDRVGLFDPGGWANRDLIDAIDHVDRIIYTHDHPDHFDIEILKSLLAKFPGAHVVCNNEIKEKIEQSGISTMVRGETQCTRKFTSPHEDLPVPGAVAPAENGYHFKDLFTHPGDSYSFNEAKKVLAMPFVSPWGKIGDGIDLAINLKPQYILPIHDWLYNDDSREWLDGLLKTSLEKHGIEVLSSKSGIRHEI